MRLGLPSHHLSISISRPALAVSVCGKMCSEACKLDIKAEAFWGRGRRKEQGARRKEKAAAAAAAALFATIFWARKMGRNISDSALV